MKQVPLMGIEIAGFGDSLPAMRLTNAELIESKVLDSSNEWIVERTGIEARYLADPAKNETVATLSAAAGRDALLMAGLEPPFHLDSIILSSTTTDRAVPATSATVQHLLGAEGSSARDINAACAGFVYGLNDGYRHIATGEDRSLVIGADLLSRITDWSDRNTAVLFGDGAGAVLLRRTEREEAGLLGWHEVADGALESILYCEHGQKLVMDGRSVYKNAVRLIIDISEQAIKQSGINTTDIDFFIPHQANKRIVDSAANRLSIDEDKVVWTGSEHANTSSASIPLALASLLKSGRVERGNTLLLAGFGAGMTAASSVIRY